MGFAVTRELFTETISNTDNVSHPQHYHPNTEHEAIDVIEAWSLNFNRGNVVKYIARAGLKTSQELQDLQKALWYLEREIERVKGLK